jgi:hypothetical protein
MRVVMMPLLGLAGLMALAVPGQATPASQHGLATATATAPAIMMVRQRCGKGMKRERAWQDKNGAWHGKCVSKH